MIRILLADDEMLIRAGVRAILDTDPELTVIAEAGDGREAVDLALAHRPDVALVDIRMPRLDGLSAGAEILRAVPSTGVAVLTTFGEDEYLSRALSFGARGFLLKSGNPRELLAGVHAIAAGGAFLSPALTVRMIDRLNGLHPVSEARARVEELTGREREVLALVGAGLSNAQIARRLHLVEGTVKGHVSAILTRLGVGNRVQAAIIAHEAGILD
ncbi:DNA-binding NarL/FixJ family response regulator [Actinoplanes campanulatus]|uniref:DNA-binding NarL/FixJ family response regulator n=1 Tax=Actinoplanes campanulatus TaxID=113559 RepID=A0A7W5FK01_9ACTN|nr:response regulator transcription factor [Actinoplanes campanulatus]MBB3101171.1 DNA-binding NarL/FixJ family response regulator [Actinoplanes campanulatus]GGN49901.1 DNA-binding response regulator [Actinoplanes campanulatus]GID41918.1 DNA-binding response regulator [Actinoplanes campanulatus]